MFIRYVVGRPTVPQEPKILKAGGVSRDARRDTTLELYLRACEYEQVTPDVDYVHHLKARDSIAWQYRLDIYAGKDQVQAAMQDALHAQNGISKAYDDVSLARNAWACERCRWSSYCEGDPLARDVDNWHDVERAKQPSEIKIAYGRSRRTLRRDRIGYCCSPSELRAFMTCPRLHWLEYVKRIRQVRTDIKSLPMLLGSITHEALRVATVQRNADLQVEVEILIAEMMREMRLAPDVQAALADPAQVLAIADRTQAMHELAMDGVAEVIECEQRRAMVLPGTKKWLHGIPDAVVRMHDGRVGVVEYKTTSRSKDLMKLADKYRTNPQTYLYAALVERGQLTL